MHLQVAAARPEVYILLQIYAGICAHTQTLYLMQKENAFKQGSTPLELLNSAGILLAARKPTTLDWLMC